MPQEGSECTPSETLHRRGAVSELAHKSGDVFTASVFLFIGFIGAKRGALVQSRTLSCMDAAVKPIIKKKGRDHGVSSPLPQAYSLC
ncbi:hypothetical protein CW735_17720 [Alteromonas sp. MB-3u-76]|jgi:hypothetical protein|nr:hypothetical protein BM528_16465 [Alteromonas sp. RW2A1]AUC89796.1 hypothetical protein CW735_17720 [Alteromonas sp. MB-3u-76]